VCWVVEHHGLFQTFYYGHHYGWDRHARDAYKDHPSYGKAVDFCERWDQASFDDSYSWEPIDTFIPIVKRVFRRKAYAMQGGDPRAA
jgi:predicted HD phosphohydrolase